MKLRRLVLDASLSAAIALVLSMIVLGPNLARLDVAWSAGDLLPTYVGATNWSGLWYRMTDHYGYPLGMNLNYIPALDITQNSFASIVSAVSGSTFLGLNLLLIISFPLTAALTLIVIRMTGLQGPVAIALSVAFAFIPYHWGRMLGHAHLATLYSAVIGLAVVLLIGSGEFERRSAAGAAHRRSFIAAFIVMMMLVAWSGVYYAAFTILLGAAALVWRLSMKASWRAIAVDALPLAGIVALAVLGLLPSIITRWIAPPLAALSERSSIESVTYAGAFATAILPMPLPKVPILDPYRDAVRAILSEAGDTENFQLTNFGTWITAACLIAMLIGLLLQARRPIPMRGPVGLGLVAYLSVVTVLLFMPWGLNLIFAEAVTGQIRAWNRLLPFLLLLFILGGAIAAQRMTGLARERIAVPVALVILIVIVVESILPFRTPTQRAIRAGAKSTAAGSAYAQQVNRAIPERCGVLQLPYMQYPEQGSVADLGDYEHLWVATTNPGKSFSYGSMTLTAASVWAAQMPPIPTPEQVRLLRGAGFCAIHLDKRGFERRDSAAMRWELGRRFGPAVATGNGGDWELFDIREVSAAPAGATWAFLHQPFVAGNYAQVTPIIRERNDAWWWMRKAKAVFTVTGTSPDAPVAGIRGEVGTAGCGSVWATVTLRAGGQVDRVDVRAEDSKPAAFDLRLDRPVPEASLAVLAHSPGCRTEGLAERRFARVINLAPSAPGPVNSPVR